MPIYQGDTARVILELQKLLRLGADDMQNAEDWVNLGMIDCIQRTEALQRTDTALLTAGCDSFNLPPEVLRIKQLTWVYPTGEESRPMEAIDLENMLEMRRATIINDSMYDRPWYTPVGENQLEVWPTPGPGDALRFWYVRYPQKLTSAPSSPFELREPWGSRLALYSAAIEASRHKKDPLIGMFEASYDYWIRSFNAHMNKGRGLSQFVFEPNLGYAPHDPSTDLYQLN